MTRTSKDLLAQSLRDFSSDAWWAIFNGLVDLGEASSAELMKRVREEVRPGDLRRAAASYPDRRTDIYDYEPAPLSGSNEDEGAYQLTTRILDTLIEQGIIEISHSNEWRVTDQYLDIHQLPDGGIRFAYNVDGNWTTYDARPKDYRDARRQADTDRLNTLAAITAAANYQRPVQTAEERSPKYATAKQAAFDLYESLLRHGYLDAFPITVNQNGRVVAGNHRLRFAELARTQLLEELEAERANGSDPIAVADLERRIASLRRDRIFMNAITVRSDADEIRVTTASEIQIPWAEHERKQLAKRLGLDGYNSREIADLLSENERTIRRWTTEERTDVKAVQQAEAKRLRDAGWSQKDVADHLGVATGTIRNWESNSGQVSETAPTFSTSKTPVTQAPPVAETEPVEEKPDRDMQPAVVGKRQRQRLEQVKQLDGRVRPRWTLEDVADAEVIRRLAGLD